MKLKSLSLIVLFTLYGYVNYCQVDSSKKENKKQLDTISLTYFYVGDGCPFCNRNHPEIEYGFKIECVGCIMTSEIERNNLMVTKVLDLKYGEGWTKEYIINYCKKGLHKFVDKTPNKRSKNLKIK